MRVKLEGLKIILFVEISFKNKIRSRTRERWIKKDQNVNYLRCAPRELGFESFDQILLPPPPVFNVSVSWNYDKVCLFLFYKSVEFRLLMPWVFLIVTFFQGCYEFTMASRSSLKTRRLFEFLITKKEKTRNVQMRSFYSSHFFKLIIKF